MSFHISHPHGRSASTATGLGPAGSPLPDGFHGRGVALNPASRFERLSLAQLPPGGGDDDLLADEPAADGRRRIPTKYFRDHTRTIINPVDSPDLNFRWTINPYRGCEHGCVYCYARPTHEYLGLSSGLDFESSIFVKTEAPELLRAELARAAWNAEPIMLSGITDPYQPIERRLRLTRSILEVLVQCGQPVSIVTKSALVLRDTDLLSALAHVRATKVAISLTTLDPALAATMEPRASSPAQRLRAMRELSQAGIPVVAMLAPIIPGVNDRELPALLQAAARAGATGAGYVLLRLPWQNKELFLDWLRRALPERADHVESLIRQGRDGKLYDASWGTRFKGQGPFADQIAQTFAVFARRLGLLTTRSPLSSAAFRRPSLPDDPNQLELFANEP